MTSNSPTAVESLRASIDAPRDTATLRTSQEATLNEKSVEGAPSAAANEPGGKVVGANEPLTGLRLALLVTVVTITGVMVLMDMTILVTVSFTTFFRLNGMK